jgi:hypothetical protein
VREAIRDTGAGGVRQRDHLREGEPVGVVVQAELRPGRVRPACAAIMRGFAVRNRTRLEDVHALDTVLALEQSEESRHTRVAEILDVGQQQGQVESGSALHRHSGI